jgi:hypothetical protein
MRLTIRAEQKAVVEAVAEENFVNRLAGHLRKEYSNAVVTLPVDDKFTVAELALETLHELVRVGIARARGYGKTHESAISAFTAVMFEVSPNFDTHRLCQVLFNDEEVEPNRRIDEVLDVLTEKNWESIRADYDPNAWKPETAPEDATEEAPEKAPEKAADKTADKTDTNKPNDNDFLETVKI